MTQIKTQPVVACVM